METRCHAFGPTLHAALFVLVLGGYVNTPISASPLIRAAIVHHVLHELRACQSRTRDSSSPAAFSSVCAAFYGEPRYSHNLLSGESAEVP